MTAGKSVRKKSFILSLLAVILAAIILVWGLFSTLVSNYRSNIAAESAGHLVEINYQIKLYIEEKIENDWNIAYSIKNGLTSMGVDIADEDIYAYLNAARDIWHVSDLLVYTGDGFCTDVEGRISRRDAAAEMVYRAIHDGEYMSIVHSTITYTIPIETNMTLKGSNIAAVSVVQDISSFLDNMGISAFNGRACLYLTRANGVVISRLTNPDASDTFNIASLLEDKELECLAQGVEHSMNHVFTSQEPIVHISLEDEGNRYIVSTPIRTHGEEMRLFYAVPEMVVNQTMESFSNYITRLSAIVIAGFAVLAMCAFLYIYNIRKKRFDKDLDTREKLFNLLVTNTNTAFALFSTQSVEPLYISSNVERIMGESYMRFEKQGSGYKFVSAGDSASEAIEKLNSEIAVWDGKGEFMSSFLRNKKALLPSYYVVHIYPVEGNEDEFVGIAQDITSTRDREEAVRTALTLADAANEAKTRFLSNMSHDIRTPMNAIVNMTDFAMESVDDKEKLREYLNTIRESSNHLLHLINDILDMSRIESGRQVIASEPFSLSHMLNEICIMLQPLYSAKMQRFTAQFSSITDDTVLGDKLKLTQVLMNLLNNAVKFTGRGGRIEFRVEQTETMRQETASFRFVVKDNGIGISKDNLTRVFEPFSRADDRRVSSVEGTGLGLSICKSYVAAMGGGIICKSEKGVGSEFIVELTFPLAGDIDAKPEAMIAQHGISFAGRRALLCEDNSVNQAIARKLLEKLGFEVNVASNGEEGANCFIHSEKDWYSIIYMDIQMPVMDGYEATIRIRSSAHPRARTAPIIAMTANVFVEDVEKSRAAGMNGHLGKPLMVNELVAETSRVLSLEE